MLKLYVSHTRPTIEHGSRFWNVWSLKMSIVYWECSVIGRGKFMLCQERIMYLSSKKLLTNHLKVSCSLRIDLLQIWKLFHSDNGVWTFGYLYTRGHAYKLSIHMCQKYAEKISFVVCDR